MPHTGLNCLNANFIYYATHLRGRGGGAFIIYSEFFLDDLHLQIIAIISLPKSICREFISPVGYFIDRYWTSFNKTLDLKTS